MKDFKSTTFPLIHGKPIIHTKTLRLVFATLIAVLFFLPSISYTQSCTLMPVGGSSSDGSCNYPSGIDLLKLDEGIPEGTSRVVYIKVCGDPCCGEILVNPKDGDGCYTLSITGPKGPGISFAGIGYADGCSGEACPEGNKQVRTICNGQTQHRITFLGWEPEAGTSCSYWYYRFESVVDCGTAISHITFGLTDKTDCCVFEASCPTDTDLGTYDCTTLDDIPDCPATVAHLGNPPYNISIGDEPCGDIAFLCEDSGDLDVCTSTDITRTITVITRTITVFDDLDGDGELDDDEDREVCEFRIGIDEDTTNPVFTSCPEDEDLGCNPTVPNAQDGDASATDNCGEVTVSVEQGQVMGDPCNRSRTDTWTAEDACGNTATCSRTYTWSEDTTNPVFTSCPEDEDLGCNPTVPNAQDGDASATDNCGEVTVSVEQGQVMGDPCNRSRTDTWTAEDACGNTATCSRTYTWSEDTTNPVFTSCPEDEDLGCNPTVPNAQDGDASATDNCGEVTVSVEQGQVMGDPCNRSRTDTWTAEDACGNTATCSRTYTWSEDTTNPVFTSCPEDEDLGCNPTVPNAQDGDASATDNCGEVTVSVEQGQVMGDPCNRSRTDTWTAEDACGNTATCSRTYTWSEDTTNPVFTSCPEDEDLGCNPTVPNAQDGDASATDNCGEVTVSVEQGQVMGDPCNRSRTDTWTAEDACGNTATCSRTYTWSEDTTNPVFTSCPEDEDLGCNPTVPDAQDGDASATDNCGEVTVSVEQGQVMGDPCNRSRTDTWTAEDACGNTATCSRTYTWSEDTTNPVFTSCPEDEDLGCNPTVPNAQDGDASATDNCGEVTVSVEQGQVMGDPCNRSRTDTWTAEDACGNTATCSRTYTWSEDTTNPVFTSCPEDEDLGCNPTVPNAQDGDASATDNCGEVTVSVEQGQVMGDPCNRSRTDTWTAEDACGNTATCSRTYTWSEDTTNPVFTSCPEDEDLGCNPTVPNAQDGDASATDNCGEVTVSVEQGQVMGDLCNRSRTDTWTAEDACGNTATCSRTYTWSEDTTNPVFTSCPEDEDLGCNPTVPNAQDGDASATDNCGEVTVSVEQGQVMGDPCNRSRTDTWTAEDACGNTATCSRTYTWSEDTTNPVFTSCPEDEDLGCNPTVPDAQDGDASATDNCGEVTVSVEQGQVMGDPCNRSRTDTWTAEDACGNTATCSRTYTWIEATVICTISATETNDCSGTDVELVATASSECSMNPDDYDYVWNTGETTRTITVGAGTHSVTVTLKDTDCSSSCDYTVTEECGTSWARNSSSICFNQTDCRNANNLPWGFTTPIEQGMTYNFSVIEGAPGLCGNGSLGDVVGTATVDWTGALPVISITTTDGEHYINQVHVWVGCTQLPQGGGRRCKASPGQLGCTYNVDSQSSFTIDDCSGDLPCDGQVWIAIHVLTCDLVCEGETGGRSEAISEALEEVNKDLMQVKAFPNPAKDQIMLDITGKVEGDVEINIMDSFGKLIQTINTLSTDNKVLIDLSDEIKNGIYFISVRNNDKLASTKIAVIKQD